jgi:hypothetical protein
MLMSRCLVLPLIALAASSPAPAQSAGNCALIHHTGSHGLSEAIDPPDEELITELIGWIASHTGYDVSQTRKDPPLVRFCKRGDTIDYESEAVMVEPHLRAAYDLEARVIYLVAPWQASRIEDQGVLLHELIHGIQWGARKWDCLQQPEYEAYRLHAAWLQEHRLPVPFDLSQIFMRSRCGKSHH